MLAVGVPLLFGFIQLAACFFFLSLASLGLPGTAGFPAEFLLLMSALNAHIGAGILALLTMVLAAAYVLDSCRRAFFGPCGHKAIAAAPELRPRELGVALAFSLPILVVGLWPGLVLDPSRAAARQWVARLAMGAGGF